MKITDNGDANDCSIAVCFAAEKSQSAIRQMLRKKMFITK